MAKYKFWHFGDSGEGAKRIRELFFNGKKNQQINQLQAENKQLKKRIDAYKS